MRLHRVGVCIAAAVFLLAMPSASGTNPLRRKRTRRTDGSQGQKGTPGVDPALTRIKNIVSGQTAGPEMLSMMLQTEGYAEILKSPQIQRKILERLPILAAIPELKAANDSSMSDADVMTNFASGIKNLVSSVPGILKHAASPDASTSIIEDLKADPAAKEILARMEDGDPDAVVGLKALFANKAFPGVDPTVLDELGEFSNRDKLLAPILENEDIMRLIDMDDDMSNVIRNPIDWVGKARTDYQNKKANAAS